MGTGRTLSVDLETYSEIDITKCGSFRYIDDESFEVLLLGYAFDDDPVTVVDLTADEEVPADFLSALYGPTVTKTAWNCAFERYGLWKLFGRYCPPEQWSDTMILSAVCGLPLGLGEAGKALCLGQDEAKDKSGKALIRYFCSPCKPTKVNGGRTRNRPADAPEKWAQFIEYNRQDVVSERAIRSLLLRWKPDETEQRFWCLDARINENGMRVDRQLVRHAIEMDTRYKAELTEQAVAISGLENPNSVAQIKQWLLEQEGLEVPSLNKKVAAEVVSQLSSDKAKQFMALRARLAKSSTKKYEAMERSVCSDGHIKGCFQFYGANRTGRFAGRLVQLQNLPQNHMEDLAVARSLVRDNDYETVRLLYDSVSDTLSELIRTALVPEPGHRFIVADFSAIEARVIAWIAGEDWRLDVFRSGGDIYCASASQMFHVPVVKHGENGHLRQKGKIAELALGYGGGTNALKAFGADKMGMTEEEMVNTVDLWRGASPRICALWRALERAAIRCVVHRTPQVSAIGAIRFEMECGTLWMTLPSGRRIAYHGAEYGKSRFKPSQRTLSYMGVDQKTKRWARVETWGGKLVENCWSAGTPVLTTRGWAPIETITNQDKIWDGVEWVSTDGCKCRRSEERLFELDGLLVTGNHKILTTKGWRHAKECDGLDRASVQLPDRDWAKRGQGLPRAHEMDRSLRLWANTRDGHSRPAPPRARGKRNILRLHETGANFKSEHNPWYDIARGLRCLALDGSALHRALASGMEKLRRPGDCGLRKMGAQLRELLVGYGADVPAGSGFGQKGEQQGLLAGELPLGNACRKLPKYTPGKTRPHVGPDGSGERALGEIRSRLRNPAVSAGSRLSAQPTARRAGYDQPVYDVMNCGPRHRYIVLGKNGPIVAHNCVQATARDCLRDTMLALDEAGYDIRAHVHDEVIISEPIDGRTVEDVADIMGRELPWAPGLPLRGDGYACDFYMKD